MTMTKEEIITVMRHAEARLHMEHIDGKRSYWVEVPALYIAVTPAMGDSLVADPDVVHMEDKLFDNADPQTYYVR